MIDCDWEYLSTLRTLEKPYDSMPRLSDLLQYLASPELEDIWILLDIKVSSFIFHDSSCLYAPAYSWFRSTMTRRRLCDESPKLQRQLHQAGNRGVNESCLDAGR